MQEVYLFLQSFINEIKDIWLYFLIGAAAAALIRTFKWHVQLRKILTRFQKLGILLATLLGVFSPLCACGILPIIVSLVLVGLPLSTAMALMVASPLMSPSGYTLALWELGTTWAVVKVVSAVFMGIYAGYLTLLFEKKWFTKDQLFLRAVPDGDPHDPEYGDERLKCFCREQFSNRLEKKTDNKLLIFLAKMAEVSWKVGKYLLLGILASVIIIRYIPFEMIEPFSRLNPFLAIVGVVLVSIPLHINQITSAAILYGILEKGAVAPGVGLAFLVGGPVVAIPALVLMWSFFKPRVFFLYLTICVSGSILAAVFYQLISPFL